MYYCIIDDHMPSLSHKRPTQGVLNDVCYNCRVATWQPTLLKMGLYHSPVYSSTVNAVDVDSQPNLSSTVASTPVAPSAITLGIAAHSRECDPEHCGGRR